MSIFGTIMSKTLGKTHASPATPTQAAPSAQPSGAAATAPSAQASTSPATPPGPSVDVAAVLDGLNEKAAQALDWRHSIVALMKLISLDSSLTARKELAKELHYDGDMSNSRMWVATNFAG
jgi:Domain of unknown function (DUF3597)